MLSDSKIKMKKFILTNEVSTGLPFSVTCSLIKGNGEMQRRSFKINVKVVKV